MPEEGTKSAVEDLCLEESLIKIESLPLSCENTEPSANDHEVEESLGVHDEETEKNVALFLSRQLDSKEFVEAFSYIWGQWTSRPHIGVTGFGWIFKLVLWCLR